jgi:ketosteroid isomerase-like protein
MNRVNRLLLFLLVLGIGKQVSLQAQKVDVRAEEAAIRDIISKQAQLPNTDDSIFWSGAYPRPSIGQEKVKPFNEIAMQQRRNQKSEVQVVRLEVAGAGDMAYEFSNFTLSWEIANTKEHTQFTGSALRVWKKVDGKWQVAASFLRPHDAPFAQRSSQ